MRIGVLTAHSSWEIAEQASVFAEIASHLDPQNLRRTVPHWEQQVEHPTALEDPESARQRQRFHFTQGHEGNHPPDW